MSKRYMLNSYLMSKLPTQIGFTNVVLFEFLLIILLALFACCLQSQVSLFSYMLYSVLNCINLCEKKKMFET